ncbi:hypothetical protein V6C27_05060 [Peptococcaceae bacterium 1198_IL3148]
MGIAFRTDSVLGVTVAAQQQVMVDDLFVGQFEWVCGAVQGQVFCNTSDPENPTPLPCALVKAVEVVEDGATPNEFLGITDENGFYAICVPPGTYDIMVLCCDTDCCEPVECGCGCGCDNGNGDDNGEG